MRESAHLYGARYARAHGLDWQAIGNEAGMLAVLPARYYPPGRFDLDDDGDLSAIVETFDRDGATVCDLVAWRVADPGRPASMFGRAALLGAWHAFNPATYYRGGRLTIFASPLAWLRAGGRGVAIIHPEAAARTLLEAPGGFLADEPLATDLARLIASAAREERDWQPEQRHAS